MIWNDAIWMLALFGFILNAVVMIAMIARAFRHLHLRRYLAMLVDLCCMAFNFIGIMISVGAIYVH